MPWSPYGSGWSPSPITTTSPTSGGTTTSRETVTYESLGAPKPDSTPDPGVADRKQEIERRGLAIDIFARLGLPQALADVFIAAFIETGNADRALIETRKSSVYAELFPGNVRPDGTIRYAEADYITERDSVREALVEFGFDPDTLGFGDLIELGVDAREAAVAIQDAAIRFTEPGADQRSPLAEMFLERFEQTGSRVTALADIRDTAQYEQVFGGMRRDDGTLRFNDEQEYFAFKRGWQRTLASYGLDPREFEARGRFVETVEAEQSINEVGRRLQTVQDGIIDQTDAIINFYATNYGLELTPEAVLGMAVDPGVQQDVLELRVKAGQIGGEASLQGFMRSIERAEELARAGVTQAGARSGFSRAAQVLPGLSATTRRFRRGDTTLDDFEDAFLLEDASEQARVRRALEEERSQFTSRDDVARGSDGLGLAGLRAR